MFIGEAPGRDENTKLQVFIGKTGEEVNGHYLPLAGLRRTECYFTNAIKCLPTSAGGKLDLKRWQDRDLLGSCAEHHLYQEMADLNPSVLVPMGAFACHAVDPAIDLDLHHGIPQQTRWGIPAFPMSHPARGLHEPKKMLEIRTDWIRLKQYLKGTLRVAADEYPEPDYAEVTDPAEIDCIDYTRPMACDTESSRSLGPYCLTYSTVPGTGRLIRAENGSVLDSFRRLLSRWESHLVFHNWLYDRSVTEALGLRFPDRAIRDTMVRAYHLGNLPQGLKAISYRELGMLMQDFDDLVTPYSTPKVLDYYRFASFQDWPKPEQELRINSKTGLWELYKPQSMSTKLKRFFTDYGKNQDKDIYNMWEDNWVSSQEMIEAKLGPWPGKDIAHVPFAEMLFYACRDADATLRFWFLTERMRRRVRRAPQERWRAA